MVDVHHIRYPKNLGTEPLDDLIAVCRGCHNKSHGKRKMSLELVPDPKVIEVTPPGGGRFLACTSSNGNAYASADAWVEITHCPNGMAAHARNMLQAVEFLPNAPGALPVAEFNGQKVYSWQAVAACLRTVDREHYRRRLLPVAQRDAGLHAPWADMVRYADRIDAITRWGWEMQSRAIAQRFQGNPATTISTSLDDKILLLAQGHVAHTQRLGRIEAIVLKPGGEFVTVQNGLDELNLDGADIITDGGGTLGPIAGMRLKRENCETGGQRMRRLDGSGHRVPVAMWRRRDVYRVLGALTGRDFSRLLME